MEINIKVTADYGKQEKVSFSNINLVNPSFVYMHIGGKLYTVSLQDLEAVVKAFEIINKV